LTYPYGVTFAQDEGKATGSNWRINLETGVLVLPNGIRMTLDSIYEPGILAETFLNDVHFRGADFSGLSVIDVGASIGDTALYFASLGAIVYAYEPDPLNFESLLRNVSLNPQLQRKIVPVNAAVGIDGQVTLHAGLGSSSGLYGKGGNELTVPSLSLRSILERNHLAEAYLLKVDAKGAEFEILSQPEIAHFHLISLEYSPYLRPGHTVAELLAVLTAQGFVVKRKFRHNDSFFRLEEHGMIHAERA
jgi:FkbM family methyltransferase